MTAEQERLLDKVRANIRESRNILDHIRYRMPDAPITDRDRIHLNQCYNRICEAYDAI